MSHWRRPDLGISLGLFAANLLVIAPFLRIDLTAQVWNNEYIYVSLARLYRDFSWGWNAVWYCGFPLSYAYPPLFPLLMIAAPTRSLGLGFHLLSGVAYALVPVAAYLLGRQLFLSPLPAILAALALSFLPAPIYVLRDWASVGVRFSSAPLDFAVLMGYAAGPNLFGLALLLLVLAAAWRGRWIVVSFGTAAVLLAHGAETAGLLLALTAVAIAQGRLVGYARAAARAFAAAAAGYGLAAFWMTAGYTHTILVNTWVLKPYAEGRPAAPWNAITWTVLLAALAVLLLALWPRIPASLAFVLAWAALSGAPVVALQLTGSHLLPFPWRYGLDFNVALLLAAAWAAGALLPQVASRKWVAILPAVALVFGGLAAARFLRQAWRMQPGQADARQLPAFQISSWLRQNAAAARVFTMGELEGSLNVWADVPQVSGQSGPPGFSNPLILAAQRQVAQGCSGSAADTELAHLWLRALHCRYLVAHGAASREHFHWIVQPERFSTLPLAWSNGAGDAIYQVGPPDSPDAVAVDRAALDRLPALSSTNNPDSLKAYVSWAEGKRPVAIHWTRAGRAEFDAELQPGEAVLVKVNYDRGWKVAGGRARPDPIGFLLVEVPPGHRRVELRHGASWDDWLGRAIALATLALLLLRAPAYATALVAVVPSALAYLVLSGTPAGAVVAEAAFRRLQPPLIAPEAIVDGATGAPPPLLRGHLTTIYGSNFGGSGDRVRVLVSGREAPLVYRDSHLVTIRLPQEAPAHSEIQVEVNRCGGNSFLVPTRAE